VYISVNSDLLHLLSSMLRSLLIARLVEESYRKNYTLTVQSA